MSDLPDYQMPISISGISIASLPVDIVAFTIGQIDVDIAAQSVGNINVNIAASAVTLNVAITSSTATLDVAIQSCAVTLNVAITSSTVTLNVAIQSSAVTLNVAIQSSITLNVKTATGEKVEVGIVSSIQLDVNIAASAITLNVHETGTANVSITSAVTLNINIASSDITVNTHETGTANVSIVSSVTINVAITSSTVTLNVAIQSSSVTLNVAIQSQAVDLNIKTSGGANIVIDKLTQSAYTARGVDLTNDNGVTSPTPPPASQSSTYWSKWFPRGCKGFIYALFVYCKRTASGTITLGYTIAPGMGEMGTITITPGTDWDWKYNFPKIMWNYDSLFIYVKSCSADVSYGLEYTDTNPDAHVSGDDGVTWEPRNYRLFIRTRYGYQSVGDLPVSGTINTIPIPNLLATASSGSTPIPGGGTVTLGTVNGAGEMLGMRCYSDYAAMEFIITIDGTIFTYQGFNYITPYMVYSIDVNGRGLSIRNIDYNTSNNHYAFEMKLPINFRRQILIQAHNPDSVQHFALLDYAAFNKIS